MTDRLAGPRQLIFAIALLVKGGIDANGLLPLAVKTPERVLDMADIPAVLESGAPGFEASTRHGMVNVNGAPRALLMPAPDGKSSLKRLKGLKGLKRFERAAKGAVVQGFGARRLGLQIRLEMTE